MSAEESHDAARGEGIDPRYDAAFQRGYQPQPGEYARTRMRSAPAAPARRPSRAPRPADPYEEPADDGYESAALTIAPDPSAAQVAQPAAAVVVTAPGVLDRLELNPRRNPLILALWIVGAGFVVFGIILYCVSVSASYTGPTPSTDVGALVFAQLGWMLAGPLITVGLITMVGLLFLTALAGRRTRDAAGGTDADDPAER
jgi:hypothetical protein